MKKYLKILLIISTYFIGITNCYAYPRTFDRNELKNYGVNKNWTINENNKKNVLNTPAVDANDKLYDFAEVLTDEEEQILKEKINNFIKETKMDMVIVIPRFHYYNDKENEDYAADFYDYNDFGMKYTNNSGVLFLRNAFINDPYFNIYTFGDAQLYFDYQRLENTLDNVYRDIKNENYLTGFEMFINEMLAYHKSGIPKTMQEYKVDDKGYLHKIYKIPFLPVTLISLAITTLIMLFLIKKNKMILTHHAAAAYLDESSIKITARKDVFITSHTTSYTQSSNSDGFGGGSGGGFSSSSGSSGGGHSSGGGRHG